MVQYSTALYNVLYVPIAPAGLLLPPHAKAVASQKRARPSGSWRKSLASPRVRRSSALLDGPNQGSRAPNSVSATDLRASGSPLRDLCLEIRVQPRDVVRQGLQPAQLRPSLVACGLEHFVLGHSPKCYSTARYRVQYNTVLESWPAPKLKAWGECANRGTAKLIFLRAAACWKKDRSDRGPCRAENKNGTVQYTVQHSVRYCEGMVKQPTEHCAKQYCTVQYITVQ